eukprot:1841997-Pyramimonas_sp.AAC.1
MDWEFGPRGPVELVVDGAQIDDWVQVMRTAKAFPSPFPAGCSARDFAGDWRVSQDTAGDDGEAWRQFIGVAECHLRDLAGLDIGKYGGRAQGSELSLAKARPPSAPRIPKVSKTSMWLKGVVLAAADA